MWVPLVENYEFDSPGADYFVRKRIDGIMRLGFPQIDTLHIGLHTLSVAHEQNREVCANRRAHRAAGRIRRRQPQGLSATPPPTWRNAAPLAALSAISPRKTPAKFRESAAPSCTRMWRWNRLSFSPPASCVHILYIIYIVHPPLSIYHKQTKREQERPERAGCSKPKKNLCAVLNQITSGEACAHHKRTKRKQERPEGQPVHSPGQRPGYQCINAHAL